MNQLTTKDMGAVMESVLIQGDLAKLSAEQRAKYMVSVCQSLGLNPYTQPFSYIVLNGKLTLYAKRDAADQLRKINGISIEIVSRLIEDGMFTVHVRAKDRDNRCDEDLGVVSLPDTLKGEARANTILKGITKAKRRVTLSISGLGFLDETEVEDIPKTARARNAAIAELPEAERHEATERAIDEWGDRQSTLMLKGMRDHNPVQHDADGVVWEEAGERPASPDDFESPPTSRPAMAAAPGLSALGTGAAVLSESETIARFDKDLADAAEAGTAALAAEWKEVPVRYRSALMAAKDRRHKPRAAEVDRASSD